jgi:hypothetical protein
MKILLIASTGITIVLALCAVDDFLSLHDIRADYVSKTVLTYLHIETSEPLPGWTDTGLEWASITVSWVVRSILILANLVVLVLLIKRSNASAGYTLTQK